MRQFDYTNATTLDEVVALLHENGTTRPLAGGTDLLTLMKADITAPERLVNIKGIDDLPRGVAETADGLSIGALTSLAEIETNPLLRQRYPALVEAAALAATPQLRNMATLGGNLLQRPRCWYFRSPHFHCWLKGGSECQARDGENQLHALFGDSPCVAAHPSDLPVALLALDANVRLRGRDGERTLPVADFFALPTDERRTETKLAADELVLSVQLPASGVGTRSAYLKAMDRKVWAFALVSVAASIHVDADGRITEARLALGGVAPVPWRAVAAEHTLVGSTGTTELFARAAEATMAGAAPLRHNAYKIPLAQALVRQALAQIAGDGATSGA